MFFYESAAVSQNMCETFLTVKIKHFKFPNFVHGEMNNPDKLLNQRSLY